MSGRKEYAEHYSDEKNMGKKDKLNSSHDNVRFQQHEEFGLITVSHPEKNNREKAKVEDVIKKMYDEGGF